MSTATLTNLIAAKVLLSDGCGVPAEGRHVHLSRGLHVGLEGHDVKSTRSGPEALSIVESFTPDVALIDINMPGMDGRQLAQLLRQRAQLLVD